MYKNPIPKTNDDYDIFRHYQYPTGHVLSEYSFSFKDKNMRHWKTKLLQLYNRTCILTGVIDVDKENPLTVAHHLYSKTKYPTLAKNFSNGVLMLDSLHRQYHKNLGKDPASITPRTFKDFIRSLKDIPGVFVPSKVVYMYEENLIGKLEPVMLHKDFVLRDLQLGEKNTRIALEAYEKGYSLVPLSVERLEAAEALIDQLEADCKPFL